MTARGLGASATNADIGTPSTMTSRGCTVVIRRSSSSLRSASSPAASPIGPQQQDPARCQATAADHPDAGVGDLAFAGLAAQLGDRLVQQAHAVSSAVRQ